MAELSTLARPYARAAFEFARDKGTLDSWQQALATLSALCSDSRVAAILVSPEHTASALSSRLIDLCGDALDAEQSNFLKVLADNKRLPLLPEISALFSALKAEQERSVDVTVVSAYPVADEAEAALTTVLSKKLERDVKVATEVDESLLGGVLIRAGDLVIDGSVRGRLNKLSEAMNS
ncbi:MAG: F0F1 ATP synthase subunit delta [Pseudomonadota bacterium]